MNNRIHKESEWIIKVPTKRLIECCGSGVVTEWTGWLFRLTLGEQEPLTSWGQALAAKYIKQHLALTVAPKLPVSVWQETHPSAVSDLGRRRPRISPGPEGVH